jgi:hypothetical protein
VILGVLLAALVLMATKKVDHKWVNRLRDYIRKKEKNIDAIEDLSELKVKKDKEIVEKYAETIEHIHKDYNKRRDELELKQKRDIAQFILEYESSPEIVVQRMANKYGWKLYNED